MRKTLVVLAGALTFAIVPSTMAARTYQDRSTTAEVRHTLRMHIAKNRRVAWRWQDKAGLERSPSVSLWKPASTAHLRWRVHVWHHRAAHAMRAYHDAHVVVTTNSNTGAGADGCLSQLISEESGWSVTATNPNTGAYGLPQALPGSKMASAGADWATNAATQIRWMWGYVNERYGGSCAALGYKHANGYY